MNLKETIARGNPSQSHKELSGVLTELIPHSPKVIVEIGVHMGGSFRVWRDVFQPDLLIGIDNYYPGSELIHEEIKDKPGLHLLIPRDSRSLATVEEVTNLLQDRKIDLLFIDGDHTERGVTEDYRGYQFLVKKGGFIGFHDINITNRDDVGVHILWKRIKEKGHKVWEFYCPEENGTGTGLMLNE